MLNIVIVDDSREDILRLTNYVNRYCGERQITNHLSSYQSGTEFWDSFRIDFYDLIFLDIFLGDTNGIDLAHKIRTKDLRCLLVFSTGSSDHAITSFRVRAFDYLLKPYQYHLFKEVMALCVESIGNSSRYIEVKEGRSLVKIMLRDILYTDYFNHYIQIHTTNGLIKSYLSFSEFSGLLLEYRQFLCCYRNCIVNMENVESISERDFLMQNGEYVPINRKHRLKIRQAFADYQFEKLNGGY